MIQLKERINEFKTNIGEVPFSVIKLTLITFFTLIVLSICSYILKDFLPYYYDLAETAYGLFDAAKACLFLGAFNVIICKFIPVL